MITLSREHQVFIAGAIGDAFGYVIEFTPWERIRSQYGSKGFTFEQFMEQPTWIVSDDTQMAMFAYEALHAPRKATVGMLRQFLGRLLTTTSDTELYEKFIVAYQAWLISQNKVPSNVSLDEHAMSQLLAYPSMFEQRAPGMTCLNALQSKSHGTLNSPTNNSKGCGGVMRAGPAGMFAATVESAFLIGCMQAVITHGHVDGILPSGWFAGIISVFLGMDRQAVSKECMLNALDITYRAGLKVLNEYPQYLAAHDETYRRAKLAVEASTLTPSTLIKEMGEGWVGDEALYVAIYAVTHAKDWGDMLWISANHSGDSDSTATLAAQLWAALSGIDEQVQTLATKLDVYPAMVSLMAESGL